MAEVDNHFFAISLFNQRIIDDELMVAWLKECGISVVIAAALDRIGLGILVTNAIRLIHCVDLEDLAHVALLMKEIVPALHGA